MKKTIVAGTASILGLTSTALGASAAQAANPDPVVDPCLSGAQHIVQTGGVSSNWYMSCIPQYAMATVDFDITSATAFPAAFQHLYDPSITVSTTTPAAGETYFGSSAPAGLGSVSNGPNADTPTSQSYEATVELPVASSASIPLGDLATAGCPAGAYTNAYKVTYLPTTVTFTQQVGGEEWRYDVLVNPTPLYLGVSLSALNDGSFETAAPMCAVGANGNVASAVDDSESDWYLVRDLATTQGNGATLSPYFGVGKAVPNVARYVPPPPPTPTGPSLAATGANPAGPLGLAALFLALGVAGGHLSRRRVKARE